MAQHNVSSVLASPWGASRPPARNHRTLLSAANVIARRLSALPPSPDVVKLRAHVFHYMDDVEEDGGVLPANHHRPDLALRILALHSEVAKIESTQR